MSVGNKILSRVLFLHLFSNILRVPMQNNNYRDSERVLWESPVCKSLLVAVKKGICERIKALFHQVTKRKEEEMVSNWKKKKQPSFNPCFHAASWGCEALPRRPKQPVATIKPPVTEWAPWGIWAPSCLSRLRSLDESPWPDGGHGGRYLWGTFLGLA